jgi:hypothetical protein
MRVFIGEGVALRRNGAEPGKGAAPLERMMT